MKRVLHLFASLGHGGAELSLFNYYKHIDKNKLQFDFVHYGANADYHEKIKQMGGRIFEIPAHSKVGLIKYTKNLKQVIKQNGPYHSVHIHTNYMSGYLAMAAFFCRVKTRVIHIHGASTGGIWVTRIFWLLKILVRVFGNKYLAVSKSCGKLYFGKKNFDIVHTSVDFEDFENVKQTDIDELKQTLNCGKKTLIIGQVGRLHSIKNHVLSIKIAKRLKEKNIDFLMIFVGEGEMRQTIETEIKNSKLDKSVLMMGYRNDVPLFMKTFEVLIQPSFSEGLPGVVMQAQAAGVRCLLSDAITREVDVSTGLIKYIDINDVDAWVNSIINAQDAAPVSMEHVKQCFIENGFETVSAAKRLQRVYLEE